MRRNDQEIQPLKPKAMMQMRCIGELSQKEFEAIKNLQGRGLKPSIDNKAIYFKNGGEEYAARIKRGKEVAVVFQDGCYDEQQIQQYLSGLEAAGYEPNKA
ncbi:hypothetical protein ACFL3V_00135 [Nanoarchaeota archaeon]